MTIHSAMANVTDRISTRSEISREQYLQRMRSEIGNGPARQFLSCGNLAHGFAACNTGDKAALRGETALNLGIVTSYNDMLSAHQPFEGYPELIKNAARQAGGVAQVAGGVPAMCDGVTQGQPGMELSLFSRDVIAMAAGIGLSHDMFDAAVYLGVCDKIIPGLLIAALNFGHIPAVFIPAGPMPSGLPNDEKSKIRQLFIEGKVSRAELLEAESQSYHSPGTCTFYGTANSNQMLMEIMGLHIPGSTFVNPGTPLRQALTEAATKRALSITSSGNDFRPVGEIIDVRSIVNGMVGLLATGGSTNHTMHLVAMAKAAGIRITWDDFSELSAVVPLLTRIYPNGLADVNHFQAAGGMGYLIGDLLDAGLLHNDVKTVWGDSLDDYRVEAKLQDGALALEPAPATSQDPKVLSSHRAPFQSSGGLKLLVGNLGRSVIKISAVKPENRFIEAPAKIFHSQAAVQKAFAANELNCDFVAIIRFQGPAANGMPELHKLTPCLGVLQDRGFKVALVTDGRMSGASGKVPAAIHVTPEAQAGGPIAKIQEGDMVRLDAEKGKLNALVDHAEWHDRTPATADLSGNEYGMGRQMFAQFRRLVGEAEEGASVL